jgi:hypothetical protein
VIDDIENVTGTREEVRKRFGEVWEEAEKAGFQWRGNSIRTLGGQQYTLEVFTRGDWLISIKLFPESCRIAAFDEDGFLCPLQEALKHESNPSW